VHLTIFVLIKQQLNLQKRSGFEGKGNQADFRSYPEVLLPKVSSGHFAQSGNPQGILIRCRSAKETSTPALDLIERLMLVKLPDGPYSEESLQWLLLIEKG